MLHWDIGDELLRFYRLREQLAELAWRKKRDGVTRHSNPRILFLCPSCQGAQEIKPEVCHTCSASLAGVAGIPNELRIDNVETQPIERITANDEATKFRHSA
jgi:hypothetical protein